jgi:hypothetical protein
MRPSLGMIVNKLSKLQRDYLVDHIDVMRPFLNEPLENATRKSMIERGLIRYEPPTHSLLGVPHGTVFTDDGREAVCEVLEQCAQALIRGLRSRDERLINSHLEDELRGALAECSAEWRRHELREQALAPPKTVTLGHAYNRPTVPTKT